MSLGLSNWDVTLRFDSYLTRIAPTVIVWTRYAGLDRHIQDQVDMEYFYNAYASVSVVFYAYLTDEATGFTFFIENIVFFIYDESLRRANIYIYMIKAKILILHVLQYMTFGCLASRKVVIFDKSLGF